MRRRFSNIAITAFVCFIVLSYSQESSAQRIRCADFLNPSFDVQSIAEILQPETELLSKRTQKKIDKLLNRFAKIQYTDKSLGSSEIESFSRKLFTLMRGNKMSPDEAVYTLAQQELLKRKLVDHFKSEGRLDETRIRNRLSKIWNNSKFRGITNFVFTLWFLPEIRSVRITEEVLEEAKNNDRVWLDKSLHKKVKWRLRFMRARSLWLKFWVVYAMGKGSYDIYGQYQALDHEQNANAEAFQQLIMDPLEQQVEQLTTKNSTELNINQRLIREFEEEFRLEHGRMPNASDPDYQIVLKIYSQD